MICVLTLLLQMYQSMENNLSLSREMDIADMCRANEHSINPVDHARQSKFLNDLDMAVLHTKFVMQKAH